MIPSLSPSAQGKSSWWRSKPSRDSLRGNRSHPHLPQDDVNPSSLMLPNGSAKSKDGFSSNKFNSLASAIGFRSKKLPTLAIQDPPPHPGSPAHPRSAPFTPSVSSPRFYSNRPPAKSISSSMVRSYEDGDTSDLFTPSEPRTPSDRPGDRSSYQPSVFPSDPDPFAAGGFIIQHLAQDPNRLSVYSDSSVLDPNAKRHNSIPNNRRSYGSNSSNSVGQHSEINVGVRLQTVHPVRSNSPRSIGSNDKRHRRETSVVPGETVTMPPPTSIPRPRNRSKTTVGSTSSGSTVAASDAWNRSSEPNGLSQHSPHSWSNLPPLRTRGVTISETGSPHTRSGTSPHVAGMALMSSNYFYNDAPMSAASSIPPSISREHSSDSVSNGSSSSPSAPVRPIVLLRKASSIRNIVPLSTPPPTDELPPTPLTSLISTLHDSMEDLTALAFPEPPSSSSSSLSFTSSAQVDEADDILHHSLRQNYGYGYNGGGMAGRRRRGFGGGEMSPVDTLRRLNAGDIPSSSSALSPSGSSLTDSSYPSSTRKLKKAASQSNLLGRYSANSPASSTASVSAYNEDTTSSSGPRKQRSFHHSRLPIPPVPSLRHANSYNNNASPNVETSPQLSSPEPPQRRTSATSQTIPHMRKRLFSSPVARRSTSSQTPANLSPPDEDLRSLLNFDGDRPQVHQPTPERANHNYMAFSALGSPHGIVTGNACVSPSSYDDELGPMPTSPMSKRASQYSEYVPQHIMNPADMLKLEAQMQVESVEGHAPDHDQEDRKPKLELEPQDLGVSYTSGNVRSKTKSHRSRANSVLSNMSEEDALTMVFGLNDDNKEVDNPALGSSTAHSSLSHRSLGKLVATPNRRSRSPFRSSSMVAKSVSKPPPSRTHRPSTTQSTITPPTSPSFSTFHDSPEQASTALPPPPRARSFREQTVEVTAKRISTVPIHPLSPPPVYRNRRPTLGGQSGPPSSSQPPSSFEQRALKRRSILRKPSFLDIEDEMDPEMESLMDVEMSGMRSSSPVDGSFLDMDRGKESFDTMRSSMFEF